MSRLLGAKGRTGVWVRWAGWWLVTVAGVVFVAHGLSMLIGWPRDGRPAVAVGSVVLLFALAAAARGRFDSQVDRILGDTVSVIGVVAVGGSVYLAVVVGTGRTPPAQRAVVLRGMIAAGIVVAVYRLVRPWFAGVARRATQQAGEPPDELMRGLAGRLSRGTQLDELLVDARQLMRTALRLDDADIWMRSADGVLVADRAVRDGAPNPLCLTAEEESVLIRAGVCGPGWLKIWLPQLLEVYADVPLRVGPVTNSGRLFGLAVAVRGAGDRPFDSNDEYALSEIARQLGLALHNVELHSALAGSLDEVRRQAAELQASRARIVAAADRERRSIERDLHDGAQQQLAALAVNLNLARKAAERDPRDVVAKLDELGGQVQLAIRDLRDLAHGIYPPLLRDRGLGEALGAALARAGASATLSTYGVGRYSPEIEAAVYFCCLEALQNAGKHAGSECRVSVRVSEANGSLTFEVVDDGAGFDKDKRRPGAGLANMEDRLGAVGGAIRIRSDPGAGTSVSGLVPLVG